MITDKNGIIVSTTEPKINRRKVWMQKSKNLLNYDNNNNTTNWFYNPYGALAEDANGVLYINEKITVNSNTAYAISFSNIVGAAWIRFCQYKKDNTFISRTLIQNNNTIIKTDTECAYVIISVNKNTNSCFSQLQIEQNSVTTNYEEYAENEIYVLNDKDIYEKFIKKEKMSDLIQIKSVKFSPENNLCIGSNITAVVPEKYKFLCWINCASNGFTDGGKIYPEKFDSQTTSFYIDEAINFPSLYITAYYLIIKDL